MNRLFTMAVILGIRAFLPLAGLYADPLGDKDKHVDLTWGVKIPMRDGVKLNATLYRPKATKHPVPVIFTLTPYIADTYHDRGVYFDHRRHRCEPCSHWRGRL